MSFCPKLSTLCSQVVFHNIPQTAKERDKKYSKIAAAVQKVKPLYFLSRSFAIRCGRYSLCLNNQTGEDETEGLEREGLKRER
jgi:hypothetical protein